MGAFGRGGCRGAGVRASLRFVRRALLALLLSVALALGAGLLPSGGAAFPSRIAALTTLARVAHAEGAPSFREFPIGPGQRVTDHIPIDLDGDGFLDLVLVRRREVSIFLQRDGRFEPERPNQRFNFVDAAIIWDHADLDGDGRPEVLFLTGDGVYYYRFEGGRLCFDPRPLLKTTSILRTASRQEIRHTHFFRDLNGDDKADLLLPAEGGFLLYRGKGGGEFAGPDRLEMRPEAWVDGGGASPTSQVQNWFAYAEPASGEFNGDGLPDVFLYQSGQVYVFLQRPDRTFGPLPTHRLALAFEGALDPGRFKLDFQLPVKFADADGDGLTDIVATHVGRATTCVFRGRADRRDLVRPDLIVKLPGITFLDFLYDLDGDQKLDLILARVDRPGLLDIVKVLITREVSVEALVFFCRGGEGLYPRTPDYRREVSIPLLFSSGTRGINVGTSATLTAGGDFDGDGVNDLIVRSGSKSLAVYPGGGRQFAEDAAFEIEVSDMDGYRFLEPLALDLNGDAVSDLVLTYYSWDGKGDRVSIVLSSDTKRKGSAPEGGAAPRKGGR